jgi:hypothetical protein
MNELNEPGVVSAEDQHDYIYLSFPILIRDKRVLRVLTVLYVLSIASGVVLRDFLPKTTGLFHVSIHLAVFALLGFLISLSYETPSLRLALMFLGIALGFCSELYEHLVLQSPLEYRDIVTDSLGVLLGFAGAAIQRVATLRASAV